MKDVSSGEQTRHRCQHRHQMGGRGGWYVCGVSGPAKSQIDRARFAGRRVREYLLERGELLKAEALFAARLLQGAEIELLPSGLYLKARREYRSRSIIPLMIACILSLPLSWAKSRRLVCRESSILRGDGGRYPSWLLGSAGLLLGSAGLQA